MDKSEMINMVEKNKKRFTNNKDSFHRVFKTQLSNYFNVITGFDICSFDEKVIKPENGESTRERIKKTYGTQGVKIIENLLK